MMGKTLLYVVCAVLLVGAVALFLRQLDSALEIDDMHSQIQLQQRELGFLVAVVNRSVSSGCVLSTNDFELEVAKSFGGPISWTGDVALLGPYRVMRKEACIVKIDLVGL